MSTVNQMVIKSSAGSDVFRVGPRQGDYLTLEFEGHSLRAVSKIYLYDDNSSLLKLFENLGQNWKGWEGVKSWSSLEGDFTLSCSADKLGHVFMAIELVNRTVEPNWTIKTSLQIDSGSLETVLSQAKSLLG